MIIQCFTIIYLLVFNVAGESIHAKFEKLTKRVKTLEQKDAKNELIIKDLQTQIQHQNELIATAGKPSDEFIESIKKVRKSYDILERLTAPKTCHDISLAGFDQSDAFLIDPDGQQFGEEPMRVQCELPEGLTIIGEPQKIKVGKCNGIRCFQQDLEYDMSDENLKSLIDGSDSCSQEFIFKCYSATTQVIDLVNLLFSIAAKRWR